MDRFKQLFAFTLMLIGVNTGWTQDTIKIQTFEWTDGQRSEIFEFPDNPDETYYKIIMKYNMRCHDAAVGSGNVGCREWDYSCNTFITDPNLVDSVFATHPDYVISNFSGDAFAYTSQAAYDYFLFDQQLTTATVNSENIIALGAAEQSAPLLAMDQDRKIQLLLTAEELQAANLSAGMIHALELNPEMDGSLPFLRIRMQATAQTSLDPQIPQTEGFSTYYFQSTSLSANGTQRFYFTEPFEWDGSSNVLLELSYLDPATNGSISLSANEEQAAKVLYTEQSDQHVAFSGSGTLRLPAEVYEEVSNEVTVALWTYGLPENLPTNTTLMEALGATNERQLNIHLPWSNGQIYWDCGNDGTGYDRINKAANPQDFEGKWNHWAFTKNSVSGEMKIYLNGTLWHSGSGLTRPIDIQNWVVGESVNGNNPYFGKIDDLRIWNRELSASEIQEWMFLPLEAGSIEDGLLADYGFDDGFGVETSGGPGLKSLRAVEQFKNFASSTIRPQINLVQGDISIENTTVEVLDSIQKTPHAVTSYEINATNDLVSTGTSFLWQAQPSNIVDEAGNIVGTVENPQEGTIDISTLEYYSKRPAKFELLSFVTPYGNGLDLGPEGKTWYFDVTDYAPILKGEKRLSLEMGGQNQEEMDIEFWFIKGTPVRDVLHIENIWPFGRGWFGPIQNDQVFEPRNMRFQPEGEAFKIRASITGHGQNGEFVSREHYLDINGGEQEFTFDVWKECGDNPVYPQGGTWIFDRAGWCPGMATDLHEYDITDWVLANNELQLDYGVNGANMTEANYLVSTQLVTYGAPNYDTDAAISQVIRPSDEVAYERINPACSELLIEVQNNGATTITSLEIEYQVMGGMTLQYEWTGSLAFLETAIIELPVEDLNFWETNEENPVFEARLTAINGNANDELSFNNVRQSTFEKPTVFTEEALQLRTFTNNRPTENRFTITDAAGNVVISRDNMDANTAYVDMIDFAPGCYSLQFEDDGDDGLQFWYWDQIGEDVGSGSVRFERQVLPTLALPVKTFISDFGGDLHFDFIIPQTNSTENLEETRRVSVFPNPTSDDIQLELAGFDNEPLQMQLLDAAGSVVLSVRQLVPNQNISLQTLPAGVYYLQLVSEQKVYTTKVIKQ
ncbi:MAG: T9SS type A sorting domain-containing protein [Saprospiraceae bacterium]|nr:T9SS type A sorting domain-containing protein [Saprospiraceae bacterium]